MTIPWDWLLCPTTPAAVEAELAEQGAPDLWLRQWRVLRDRMAAGDELWEYCVTEDEAVGFHWGFALVRGDDVIDAIESPF